MNPSAPQDAPDTPDTPAKAPHVRLPECENDITIPLPPGEPVHVRDWKNGGTRIVTYEEWLQMELRRIGPGVEIATRGHRVYLRRKDA